MNLPSGHRHGSVNTKRFTPLVIPILTSSTWYIFVDSLYLLFLCFVVLYCCLCLTIYDIIRHFGNACFTWSCLWFPLIRECTPKWTISVREGRGFSSFVFYLIYIHFWLLFRVKSSWYFIFGIFRMSFHGDTCDMCVWFTRHILMRLVNYEYLYIACKWYLWNPSSIHKVQNRDHHALQCYLIVFGIAEYSCKHHRSSRIIFRPWKRNIWRWVCMLFPMSI